MATLTRHPPHWHGVRLRIGAAFSALALVLFVGVGLISGEQARRQSHADMSASLQRQADRLARNLDAGMSERFREIRNLSTLENILGEELTPAQWRQLVERLQASFSHYTWIGVTDTEGKVLAATGGILEGRDVSKRPWFAQGMQQPFVGNVHDALLLQSLLQPGPNAEPMRLMDFAAPMRLGDRVTGVLGAHLSWGWVEERRREAQKSARPGREIEIVLTDPDGTALLRPGLPTLQTPGRSMIESVREGAATIEWPDGVRYLTAASVSAAYAGYPGMNWTVVVRQPESTATAASTALMHRIWAVGAFGALIFGLVGWWLAGRLTAPLRALAGAASVVVAEAPEGDGPKDEVTQLAGALGALIQRLRQRDRDLTALNETLEGRVQERTESLRRANDDLQSFSRSVSHDLRGPIGSIALVLRNVLGQPDLNLPERPRLMLSEVARECDRLRLLVDELLTLAMVEQRKLEMSRTSMRPLVQAVLDELASGGAPGAVAHTLVGELPEVHGDAVLLRQVWLNLLSNAVKFTGRVETPRIEVSVQEQGDERVFCVADNGAGFDMSQAPRLFGVFQRLHRASDFPGTGVGLSIVKRVVHRHGGRVWAESKPGEGARFYFALPKADDLLSSTSA